MGEHLLYDKDPATNVLGDVNRPDKLNSMTVGHVRPDPDHRHLPHNHCGRRRVPVASRKRR
jgi:hypothetical protein